MFDSLMRWTILPQPDGVMCQNKDDALLHQCRNADGSARILAKNEEGATLGYQYTMPGHSSQFGDHTIVFPVLRSDKRTFRGRVRKPC